MQTTVEGAVILKNNQNVWEENGKTWAKTSYLRLWPKNPREITNKNLKKLENQIKELGIYKPLVVTPDGEILGGNMRFRVIQELAKTDARYQQVWVSVVEAWTDEERLKYAISDNFSAGEYTRDKIKELVEPLMSQSSMFGDYDISFEQKQSITDFIDNMAKSDEEVELEKLEETLKKHGLDETVIMDIKEMSQMKGDENIYDHEFSEGCVAGTGVHQYKDKKIFVLKLAFTEENEETYQKLIGIYNQGKGFIKQNHPNIYAKLSEVYSQGKGDILVKSMHLINELTKQDGE